MKRYIILLFFCLTQIVLIYPQTFTYKGKDLFGTQQFLKDSLQRSTNLLFHDLDADGDQDLILSGIDSIKYDQSGNITSFSQISYFISVQENIGTRKIPKFAARKIFMDSFPFRKGYFIPAAGDLNDDHKLDFIVSSGLDSNKNMTTLYYQRKETSGKDQFNIISGDMLGLDPFVSGSFFTPSLADMDKDGDLDIFMSGYFLDRTDAGDKIQRPVFLYAKNTGTKSNPVFIGWYQNTNGLDKSIGETQLISIGDIDNDNDNDFISLTNSNSVSKLLFLENIARPDGKADFKLSKPLTGIPTTKTGERYYPPALVDIDGDGDLDLFMLQDLSKTATGIGFYENNLCVAKSTQLTRTICEGDSIVVGNQKFTQTGQYDVFLKASNLCDSTVKLNLTVNPKATTNLVKSICAGEEFTIGNVKFNQTGQYEVKLKASNLCDSIVKLNLTVHPIPTTNLVKSLCSGDEFTIGNVKFNQTGQYEVKLKSSNGCDSIVQASLTFVVLNNTVTQTNNLLTANLSGVNYQWFDCDNGSDIPGAQSQSFAPAKNGKYGVKLTDANGCKNTSACVDFVITSNEEGKLSNQIILYPNPASNYLTLSNQTGYTLTSIKIMNMDGTLVKSISNQQMNKISTAALHPGNYFMEIHCNGYKVFKKFEVVR